MHGLVWCSKLSFSKNGNEPSVHIHCISIFGIWTKASSHEELATKPVGFVSCIMGRWYPPRIDYNTFCWFKTLDIHVMRSAHMDWPLCVLAYVRFEHILPSAKCSVARPCACAHVLSIKSFEKVYQKLTQYNRYVIANCSHVSAKNRCCHWTLYDVWICQLPCLGL